MKIGILGAGQLGRMLGLAGIPLGHSFCFFDTHLDSPAASVGEVVVGQFSDREALQKFAHRVDCITYEFENVPVLAAEWCAEVRPLAPSLEALKNSQHRVVEKKFLHQCGVPTAHFWEMPRQGEANFDPHTLPYPVIVKTTVLGYDGKGQRLVRNADELRLARAALSGDLIVEEVVQFDRELSQIATRSVDGEIVYYPLVENSHRHGILRKSVAPAPRVSSLLAQRAHEVAKSLLERLSYVGTLTVELFALGDQIVANEIAPRVHNSGHWSIEGAETSQFENHIRAISGSPLGPTSVRGFSTMLNLIGELPKSSEILQVPGAHLHLYGKEPRPGRKVGHITVRADTEELLAARVTEVETRIPSSP